MKDRLTPKQADAAYDLFGKIQGDAGLSQLYLGGLGSIKSNPVLMKSALRHRLQRIVEATTKLQEVLK